MKTSSISVAVLAGVLACATLAGAKEHEKVKVKEHGKGRKETVVVREGPGGRSRVVVFEDHDRAAVRSWWTETYRDGCPPGLAKKHNGCLPPGLARKRYVVGQRLPVSVVVDPLPPVLVTRLAPPPPGYQYGYVDGDVVKLAIGTRLVVDAINALAR